MLIEFKVENYRSFKNLVTFSMVAIPALKEHRKDNTFPIYKKVNLLKNAIVFGANASGKSNLLKALTFIKNFVHRSSTEMKPDDKINVSSFKLSTETENKPSFFEITFMANNVRYRYGFKLDNNKIHREWLLSAPNKVERLLFLREEQVFKIGPNFKEGKGLGIKTRHNALFLSVVAQFNGEIAGIVSHWFKNLTIIQSSTFQSSIELVTEGMKDPKYKDAILGFLKVADLAIDDISFNEEEIDISSVSPYENAPKQMKDFFNFLFSAEKKKITTVDISCAHKKYTQDGNEDAKEFLDLNRDESAGTQKLFHLAEPIIKSLVFGNVLIIDEFDSRLHPSITKNLTVLFNSANNSRNAQMIAASHDTGLLSRDILRRDQIWLTEKDRFGATDLYSLADFKLEDLKKIRKDASYRKDYLLGKYGAIPYINNFDFLQEYKESNKNDTF